MEKAKQGKGFAFLGITRWNYLHITRVRCIYRHTHAHNPYKNILTTKELDWMPSYFCSLDNDFQENSMTPCEADTSEERSTTCEAVSCWRELSRWFCQGQFKARESPQEQTSQWISLPGLGEACPAAALGRTPQGWRRRDEGWEGTASALTRGQQSQQCWTHIFTAQTPSQTAFHPTQSQTTGRSRPD